jgi:DNA primase large subunit
VLVIASGNKYLKKRYALAEAKSAYQDLSLESRDKLIAIGHDLGWDLAHNIAPDIPYELTLTFHHYLRNAASLRSGPWRLVNRLLSNGHVYLARNEAARLMQEEVRGLFERRLDGTVPSALPEEVVEEAGRLSTLAAERGGKDEAENLPAVVIQEAFPPCIKTLYEAFASGHHLSHIGRFTLTSFLITVGMPAESVVELFKGFSDFSERMTRYQVEHIAGERGSRTRYRPPRCDTLRTHGVCSNPDALCTRIRHPANYYKVKARGKSLNLGKQE